MKRLVIHASVYHEEDLFPLCGVARADSPCTVQGRADIVVRVVEHVTYEYLMHPIHN